MLARRLRGSLLAGLNAEECLAGAGAREAEDLRRLLGVLAGGSPSEAWVAEILIAACMGSNHPRQDLGLWARRKLSARNEKARCLIEIIAPFETEVAVRLSLYAALSLLVRVFSKRLLPCCHREAIRG